MLSLQTIKLDKCDKSRGEEMEKSNLSLHRVETKDIRT
jgi:hypothetical protein